MLKQSKYMFASVRCFMIVLIASPCYQLYEVCAISLMMVVGCAPVFALNPQQLL
jgi:hypothetical protein